MKHPNYTYKKLHYLFNVHDTYNAGIMLEGWEVKSLLNNRCSIDTAYCCFKDNQLVLSNANISPEKNHLLNDIFTIKESRDRILLLNKLELNRIKDRLAIKGYTCIPSKLYYNDIARKWKLEIALVTGKKLYDRREDIKKRDTERQMKRES